MRRRATSSAPPWARHESGGGVSSGLIRGFSEGVESIGTCSRPVAQAYGEARTAAALNNRVFETEAGSRCLTPSLLGGYGAPTPGWPVGWRTLSGVREFECRLACV
jgi:hypothetical protein